MTDKTMDKISAALDSPIGRMIDNASPKIGAASTFVGGTAWYLLIPWSDIILITSAVGGVFFMIERGLRLAVYVRNNFIRDKGVADDSSNNE